MEVILVDTPYLYKKLSRRLPAASSKALNPFKGFLSRRILIIPYP